MLKNNKIEQMKYSFFIISIVLLFACNENAKPIDSAPENTNAEETTLKKAFEAYPDSIILLQNLVQYYGDGGNYDAAISIVDKAIKKDSTNPVFWDIRSAVFTEKGDTASAIKSLNKAIEIYPLPSYIISLGALYAETKNPKALEIADALLFANKAKAEKEAYFIKGLYYSLIKEKEKAIVNFDKCIAISYTYKEAYLEKALALYDLAKYREAAEVLEKATTLQNSYADGYYYLGKCYEKLNRMQDAIDAYQMASYYDKDFIEAKDALSRLGVK
jgi:tetratricopeptide (TPR) repeat protein